MRENDKTNLNLALVSSYLPNKCGIATFSKDLCDAISPLTKGKGHIRVIAIDTLKRCLKYDDRVIYRIQKKDQTEYIRAAEFLNLSNVDLMILQHEYGLYGGEYGDYIIKFLENLRIPIITTLHTVLSKPNKKQKQIIQQIASLSDRIIIMTLYGKNLLEKDYSIPSNKISLIPHGIHDTPFVDSALCKDKLGLVTNRIISTFGLLSPNKCIEIVIEAMPRIIEKYPDTVYIIIGQTHPEIIENEGEKYRSSLLKRVKELNLESNIIFHNKFIELQELIKYISATDIYISPYCNKEQISSGTLSYAIGAGKAVISTPYYYAEEILANKRGVLIPFNDPEKLADAVIELFSSDLKRNKIRTKAYQYSRPMVWSNVGQMYLTLIKQIIFDYRNKNILFTPKMPSVGFERLPSIDLNHFKRLVDTTGILQHATFSIPNRYFGYSLDDNARALIVIVEYYDLYNDNTIIPLLYTIIAFIIDAYNYETNRFRNIMSYEKKWLEISGSEDSHGRALWSIGFTIYKLDDSSIRACLCRLFRIGLVEAKEFKNIRSIAFTLLGIHYYLKIYSSDVKVRKIQKSLVDIIYRKFKKNVTENWLWYEDILTYSNAKIAQALLISGFELNNQKIVDLALKVLDWLLKIQTTDKGYLTIIGNNGWMKKNGQRAYFDQQPIEAETLLEACIFAYEVTNSQKWLRKAKICFNWFLGYNDCSIPLYDSISGGCFDGLEPNHVNQNIGAESTIAWLMSLLIAQRYSLL